MGPVGRSGREIDNRVFTSEKQIDSPSHHENFEKSDKGPGQAKWSSDCRKFSLLRYKVFGFMQVCQEKF